MKLWERALLLVVAGWVVLELGGRLGFLLAVATAQASPPPFRIHYGDVLFSSAIETRIACPGCYHGRVNAPPDPGLPGRPICVTCHGRNFIEARELGRPIRIVAIDQPTDYP
jgi:hypothetical protein